MAVLCCRSSHQVRVKVKEEKIIFLKIVIDTVIATKPGATELTLKEDNYGAATVFFFLLVRTLPSNQSSKEVVMTIPYPENFRIGIFSH